MQYASCKHITPCNNRVTSWSTLKLTETYLDIFFTMETDADLLRKIEYLFFQDQYIDGMIKLRHQASSGLVLMLKSNRVAVSVY